MSERRAHSHRYSVVIPAYNEASVIERCVKALLEGAEPGELEIVVVCNGCSDDTAKRAARFGPPVRVLETPKPSKSEALNLGDREVSAFPRFYVDADVVFDIESLRRIGAALADGRCQVAAPEVRADLQRCDRLVRAYYRLWRRLPHVRHGMIGSGVYGISESGRRRFEHFPDLISDDGYVRLLFDPSDRLVDELSYSVVMPPKNIRNVFRIRVRSHMGTIQLRDNDSKRWEREPVVYTPSVLEILRHPGLWAAVPVYACVTLAARWTALWRYRKGGAIEWERDLSSRIREEGEP